MSAAVQQFVQHVERWKGCQLCELAAQRTQAVFARGTLPADLLFCAEAPGAGEDAYGQPMIGPAGRLMDQIIQAAVPKGMPWVICNLVCCYPREAKKTDDHRPPPAANKACSKRLCEFVRIARPKLIVAVGSLARDWLEPKRGAKLYEFVGKIPLAYIAHPASMLPGRTPVLQGQLMVKKTVVTVAGAIREHLGED